MTRDELDALEALLAKATPGEWEPWTHTMNPEGSRWIIDSRPAHAIACGAGYEPATVANAAAIVAMHNAAPALIATARQIAAKDAEIARLREALEQANTPDMFWDPDNPERPLSDPTDGIESDGWGRETGVVHEVWEGKRMGSCYVAALPPIDGEGDDNWEFVSDSPNAVQLALDAELARRAALGGPA